MKTIVFVSASPKINEPSASNKFLKMAEDALETAAFDKTFIDVRKSISSHNLFETYETLSKADAIIISFPLYVYCLPGLLIRFLQDYYNYCTEHSGEKHNPKIYAIVNCGFIEPEINKEAVRVIKSFSRHIQAQFRFGVLIGGGPMIFAAEKAPFMKNSLQKLRDSCSLIAQDITDSNLATIEDIEIGVNSPLARRLYYYFGTKNWFSTARKNGLQKKDLYRKPYITNE